MDSEGKLWLSIFSLFAIVIIVAIVLGYEDCKNDSTGISDCIKAGQPALNCRHAFHQHSE